MRKILRLCVCLVLLFSISFSLIGASVSGIRIVNNTSEQSDYKLNETELKPIISSIDSKSDINETFTSNSGIIESDNEVLNYLIENNIISRESKIKFSQHGIEIEKSKDDVLTFNRTDFLMGLYKTVEGVIQSRPFVFNVKSKRVINNEVVTVEGNTDKYVPNSDKADNVNNFDEGDYEVYISPNVQELYLVELLDRDILQENEFKDINFINFYDTIKSGQAMRLPEWDNSLLPYYYDNSKTGLNDQLGKAWKPKGILRLFNNKTKSFTLEREPATFLVDESLTKLEALRYVNQFINEDNKTYAKDKEDIINYLFSNTEINALADEDREMVLYLLSLGILDKENINEVTGFNNPINTDFVLNLFYRIHDVNNRVQVDLDTLSEDDKVLIEQGFIKNNVGMYNEIDKSIEPTTLSIERIEPSSNKVGMNKTTYSPSFADPNDTEENMYEVEAFKPFGSSSFNRGNEILIAEKENAVSPDDLTTDPVDEIKNEAVDYKIKKLFPSPDRVEFKGKTISNLSKGEEVSDVTKDDKGIIVTFTVKASSDTEALALIDSKLTYDLKVDSDKQLQTVTQVSNDKTVTNYISAREIERSLGELMVMSSKVLKNRVTGTMAILLEDNNTAMVGNKVIKTHKPMVIDNTADTYYNLEVIVSLMSNAYISKIDPGKMFIAEDLPDEKLVDVSGTGGVIERATVMSNNAIKPGFFSKASSYYNVNMLTRGVTSLTRDFLVNDKKVTVIVDWAYSLPDNDKTIMNYFKDPQLSVKEASEFLFTRPTESKLQDWWDNNIELSNALANFIYGTENISYVTSGYLKPDLSVLIHDSSEDEEKVIDELFKKLQLPYNYLNKYAGGSLDDFEAKLFSGEGDVTDRRIFYCAKAEDVNNTKVFDNMYLITSVGSVYKNIDQDKRVKFEDGQLKVNGRDSLTEEISTSTEVKLGDKTHYLQNPATTVDRYWKLTDIVPIEGKVVKNSDNTFKFTDDNGKDILRDEIEKSIKELGLKTGEHKALVDYKDSDLSSIGSTKELVTSSLYYSEGKVIKGQKFDTEDSTVGASQGSLGIKSGSTAYAFKNIYLDRSLFTVENGVIVRRRSSPYLEQGNVFFSGLNSALMARLIDNQVDTISYGDIPIGSQVIIQDYKFRKTNQGLESAPIHDRDLTNSLVNSASDEESINRIILSKFTGLQLLFSGRVMPFSSYIRETGIGSLQFDEGLKNTVYLQNGTLMLGNQDSKVEYGGGGESVCIRMNLDNDVNFYLLDDSTNTYAMKYTSDRYSDGYIDSISAFNEDLGLGVKDDIFMELTDNVFAPMEGFRDIFKEYQQVYHSMLKGDLIGILQYIALTIIMYLIVMCFVMTMILKGHVGLNILLALRNPSGVAGKEGFDPVKIFSLGIWDLNSSPNLGVVFIAELGLFLLFYIVLNSGMIIRAMFY